REAYERESCRLRIDLDGSTDRHQPPHVLDLGVADGYTSVRPVDESMKPAEQTRPGGQAMNHDVSAWIHSHPPCPFPLSFAGIRNMQSQMESGLRITRIDPVIAFRRFAVSLGRLRTDRIRAECHPIRTQDDAAPHQNQLTSGLVDNDRIGFRALAEDPLRA